MSEQGRRRARARTWPQPRQGSASGELPRVSSGVAESLRATLGRLVLAEAMPERVLPWLAVAFSLGIAIYFTAEHEPQAWAAVALALAGLAGVILARRRPLGFYIALASFCLAAGFATATLRSAYVAHPVIERPLFGVAIAGVVESREERERSDRIVVRIGKIEGARLSAKPERVRLSVRKGSAPAVGAHVELKARLTPPPSPVRPGGYDFARDLYFQRIGATGFVTGAITVSAPTESPGFWLSYAKIVEGTRDAIDARIRGAISGDAGAIASALITGKRDAISESVNEAMYVSSLAHVLSISGYHMAVVAGVVFFVVRALLALSTSLALRFPIKKWAAAGALLAATLYLLLSGAEVATRRAYIMTAIVLVGVMLDRSALTLRNLALAAFAVLALAPEALVHPSFQMSFAATLALIAAYERGLPWTAASAQTPLAGRLALLGLREVALLIVASLVAGLATTPFAAYHFHRAAPYGLLSNLFAMPIVSAWIMPSGLLALVAMPFGFDAPVWRLMGSGIEWMTAVAVAIAALPGAVGRVTAFGVAPLILCSAGLVVMCLLRTPLRFAGLAPILAAALWAVMTPQPDIYVSASRDQVAVRSVGGTLAVMRTGSDTFGSREWLAADADARSARDPTLSKGAACDADGCLVRLVDGRAVALAKSARAVAEDCTRTALVVTTREAPPHCTALVLDRRSLKEGAVALHRSGGTWVVEATRPKGQDRPWARAPQAQRATAQESDRPARRPTPGAAPVVIRNATPPADVEFDAGE